MSADEDTPASKVHVIDDEEAVRRALEMLLQSVNIPVSSYSSGYAFLDAHRCLGSLQSDCLITDVRMPGLDGLEFLRRLREGGFKGNVAVMTAHGDVSMAVRAMKAGAVDFIEKPFSDEALLAVVGAARSLTPATNVLGGEAAARIAHLSPREREVLDMLAAGKSNKTIARDLGLSPRTVEIHRARLMTRLGVDSLAEAIRLAVWAELHR